MGARRAHKRNKSGRSLKKQVAEAARTNRRLRKVNSVESVPNAVSIFRSRADSWENVITGLGMQNRDKRNGARIKVPMSTNEWQLFEDLYHGDDMFQTIVNTPAQEMVRAWITIQNDDDQEDLTEEDKGGDQSQTQLGVIGGDQTAVANKDLKVASKNVAPATTTSVETGKIPAIPQSPREKKTDAFPDSADPKAPPLPGPENDDAASQIDEESDAPSEEDNDAEEKMLVGKATLQKLEAMEAQTKIFEALVWSRVFGGSLLFMGIDDGGGADPASMSKPLDEENIKSFLFLSVFDRWDVDVYTWYRDPKHEKFGLPESYRIRQTASAGGTDSSLAGDIIHETRVIRFDGGMVNRRRRLRNAGWADSIAIPIADVIRDFAMAWGGVAHLLQDFAQAVFKMKDLAILLAQDGGNVVLERMKIMDMARGVSRAIPIDAELEEFERKQTPVTGMPDLLDRFALRVAAAARMPVTLLMGQAPAGLNATGDADTRSFYDHIKAQQEKILRPRLNRLLSLLFKSADGPTQGEVPKNWSFTFNPLWQATDLELAQLRKTQAEADTAYITAQVLTPEEVAQSRFGGDRYSTETVLDTDQRAKDAATDEQMKNALHDAYKAQPDPVDGSPKPMLMSQDEAAAQAELQQAQNDAAVKLDEKDELGHGSDGKDGSTSPKVTKAQAKVEAARQKLENIQKKNAAMRAADAATNAASMGRGTHEAAITAHESAAKIAHESGDEKNAARHEDFIKKHRVNMSRGEK